MGNFVGSFDIQSQSGSARSGLLRTGHGAIRTPIFMPVGTRAAVRGVDTRTLSECVGARMLMVNAYHLYLRPGMDVLRDLGGLHNFMQWDYGLASDSGGFQVFSLPCKVEEDGVLFSSPVDGSAHRLRPEDVMDIQYDLGSDIIMPLDCCMPHDVSFSAQEKHMERTHRWLFRAMRHYEGKEKRKKGQALFPITQGGVSAELRQRSSQAVLACASIGYAIGGLSVGESRAQRNAMLEISCAHLPVFFGTLFNGSGSSRGYIRGDILWHRHV